MLSFLREQRFGADGDDPSRDSSEQEPLVAADTHAGDGTEQTQSQEYITVGDKDKNVRKSTILLAVLFFAGLLCLWLMIKKSAPTTAAASATGAEESQIETAIGQLTGIRSEMFDRMDEIVNKFYQFSNVQQVGVGELVKNPFRYDIFLGNARAGDSGKGDSATDTRMMQEQMREQTKDLELLSIMGSGEDGSGRCCMIDDKILYEGDLIRGFRIRQIGDNFVTLEWDKAQLEGLETGPENGEEHLGAQIVLKLSE